MVKLIQTLRKALSNDYTLEYTDDRDATMFDYATDVSLIYRDNVTDKCYRIEVKEETE